MASGNSLTPEQQQQIMALMPYMSKAVQGAENNKNMGVLSVPTSNPKKTMEDSVYNNFVRWSTGQLPAPWINERPKKFVDFMRRRWAPLKSEGATNDPKNLNINWAPNVRKLLQKQMTPQEYENLRRLDIVMQGMGNGPLV